MDGDVRKVWDGSCKELTEFNYLSGRGVISLAGSCWRGGRETLDEMER